MLTVIELQKKDKNWTKIIFKWYKKNEKIGNKNLFIT